MDNSVNLFEQILNKLEVIDSKLQNNTPAKSSKIEQPLNEDEAEEFLGVTRQTLYNLRKAGKVKYYRINSKLYYKASELIDLLQKVN